MYRQIVFSSFRQTRKKGSAFSHLTGDTLDRNPIIFAIVIVKMYLFLPTKSLPTPLSDYSGSFFPNFVSISENKHLYFLFLRQN